VARSGRYRALLTRLRELRWHLLPQKFDPTAAYSPRQVDRILAYRLLAHAELEHCLEQLVTQTVGEAWTRYKTDRRPRTCLTALVSYYEGNLGGPPDTLNPLQPSKKLLIELDARIDKARVHHLNQIVRNTNSLNEKAMLRLLMPVGIRAGDFEAGWLSEAEAFTDARGSTAHQSRRAQQIPDPESEYKRVRTVAAGIAAIDRRLTALRGG
jgi:hypothetical protein